jgi:hypothetical protein
MTGADEVLWQQGMLSQEEITERFEKVFNRKMTPEERRGLFLVLPLKGDPN